MKKRWFSFSEWKARRYRMPRETDYYCPSCHRFLTLKELVDGHSQNCELWPGVIPPVSGGDED